ncbi:MAG TPA: hypothetical protein P5056_02800 [Candidatus Paceibacterota bacterium]|nr:hypothetical protein [Candidatus Paceibacterota bacterium]
MKRALTILGFGICPVAFLVILELLLNLKNPSFEFVVPWMTIISWVVLFCISFDIARSTSVNSLDMAIPPAVVGMIFGVFYWGIPCLETLPFLFGWFLGIVIGMPMRKKEPSQ